MILEIKHLNSFYGSSQILFDMNLEVDTTDFATVDPARIVEQVQQMLL